MFFIMYSFSGIDIDECMTGNYTCHQNQNCINTLGSYDCQCFQSYAPDGENCTGICIQVGIELLLSGYRMD